MAWPSPINVVDRLAERQPDVVVTLGALHP